MSLHFISHLNILAVSNHPLTISKNEIADKYFLALTKENIFCDPENPDTAARQADNISCTTNKVSGHM